MPYKSKGPCTYPGCNTLTLKGRCAAHTSAFDDRPTASKRGYDHKWTRLRNAYIKQYPVCEIQEKCNGDAATEVDHVRSLANGGERLDEDNLQSTCKRCHSWKTRNVDAADKAKHR